MSRWYCDESFVDKAVQLCHQKYSNLPKKGKPQKDVEWTLLAGVLVAVELGKYLSTDMEKIQ